MATPYYPVAGSQDVRAYVDFWSLTDGTPVEALTAASTSLAIYAHRPGETLSAITLSNLSSINAAHSDGGFIAMTQGAYRLDLPDWVCATGAAYAYIKGKSQIATMTPVIVHLNLSSAADVADAVWDEPTTAHQTAGTPGAKMHGLTFTTAGLVDARVENVAGVDLALNGTGNQLIGG